MIDEKISLDKSIVILAAEDDNSSYIMTEHTLRRADIENEIIWLKDGRETLAFFYGDDCDFDENKKYILLLDIHMPKVDGMQVLKKIRRDDRFRHNVSVIMLTVDDDPANTRRCYELGCNAHVIKPADEGLIGAIERVAALL